MVVGIQTTLGAGQIKIQIPAGVRDFFFSKVSRIALAPTQPPIQSRPGFFHLR
jgi:hypothetical protein